MPEKKWSLSFEVRIVPAEIVNLANQICAAIGKVIPERLRELGIDDNRVDITHLIEFGDRYQHDVVTINPYFLKAYLYKILPLILEHIQLACELGAAYILPDQSILSEEGEELTVYTVPDLGSVDPRLLSSANRVIGRSRNIMHDDLQFMESLEDYLKRLEMEASVSLLN